MVTNFAITGSTEILQVADAVAREKSIPKDKVIEALKEAVETVARKKYGVEQHIRAEIDERSGQISLFRDREVVTDAVDHHIEISLKDAQSADKEVKLGDTVSDPVPPIDFGRVASQTFKQVIIQKVRQAEREKQYEDFKGRVGEIVTGVVKSIEFGNLIVDFGKTETLLPRDQIIPREVYRPGDRIRAYIVDVRREDRGQQIILSRTHPNFLAELFAQEVPEIYDGLVTIQAVARDPGSRAKMAVFCSDSSIDPVGACIGPRGARVSAVYNELQGEKIDIIQWSPDLATLTVHALAAKTRESMVEVSKIVIDEERHTIEAVVPDDQLSLAIGRRGQNVRLAAELVEWNIDVMSESDDSERRVKEFEELTQQFMAALDVEEVIGQLLASEGFKTLEEVAYVDEEELLAIEGFEEELVAELRARAVEYLEKKQAEAREKWQKIGVEASIAELPHLTDTMLVTLGEQELKTLDDVADLSRDEFREIFPRSSLSDEEIDEMIMQARAHWFEGDDKIAAEG